MHHTKFQPNMPCHSEEKVNVVICVIFRISGHFGFLTKMNFIILKPCSLVKMHMKENHGCSVFGE